MVRLRCAVNSSDGIKRRRTHYAYDWYKALPLLQIAINACANLTYRRVCAAALETDVALARFLQQALRVFGQQKAFAAQTLHGGLDLAHVTGLAAIAFFERGPRIAAAVDAVTREWNERAVKVAGTVFHMEIGRAHV